ncbi:hypothetical protein [Aliikangiella sp. IMCC44632]
MSNLDNVVELRIRWRAKMHELSAKKTMFWEDAPASFKVPMFEFLGAPVILSIEDDKNFIIICTRGVHAILNGEERAFLHTEISGIVGPKSLEDIKEMELKCFKILLDDGSKIKIEAEQGAPLLMIWNVLVMLEKMC